MSADFELWLTYERYELHQEKSRSWEVEWGAVNAEKTAMRRAFEALGETDDYNVYDDGCGHCGVCDVCTFDPLDFYALEGREQDSVFRARAEDRHHARRARHSNRGARAAHLRRREVSRMKYFRSMTHPEICLRTVRVEHMV